MGEPVRFTVSPGAASVRMTARSNVHPIHGETNEVDGYVEVGIDADGRVDLTSPPRARLQLEVQSVSTGNTLYDNEIARRLEVRKFPRIVGELTTVCQVSEARYRVNGALSFHGVTQSVDTEMTVRIRDENTLTAEWEQTIDIRHFGLSQPKVLGFKVNPLVKVDVLVNAAKAERNA